MSATIYHFPTRPLLDRIKAREDGASAKDAKYAQQLRIKALLQSITDNLDIIDAWASREPRGL